MCWLDDLLDFWFPEPVEVDNDGESPVEIPRPGVKSISSIPEMYLRSELIPVKEPDKCLPAVEEAERVVRSRR